MAKSSTKISYDSEEDILTLSRGRNIKASIDIGDFIIDVDHKGFISGIEILNASSNTYLAKKQLSDIKTASMCVTYKPNYVYIRIILLFKGKEKETFNIPLTVDLGHGSVRTEKANFAAA